VAALRRCGDPFFGEGFSSLADSFCVPESIQIRALAIKAEPTMFTTLKNASVLVALVCVAVGCMTGSASAVTAQLAKKCQALTTKAFPPRVPGNPAAGSAKGTGQSQRAYFNRCVANGGNLDDDTPTRRK
jgi:hypothetical protein